MEKRKKIKIIIFAFLLVLVITAVAALCVHKVIKDKEEAQTLEIQLAYKNTNYAFGFGADYWYISAEELENTILEKELKLKLYFYQKYLEDNGMDTQTLTYDEITEFLSSEYDEDGNLKILNIPDSISAFVDWYMDRGEHELEKFWDSEFDFRSEYIMKNSEILLDPLDMTAEQLDILIEKMENEDYTRSEDIENHSKENETSEETESEQNNEN